jgi:hypothetical protein
MRRRESLVLYKSYTILSAVGCEGRRKKTYNILGHNVGLEQRELPPFGMPATDS